MKVFGFIVAILLCSTLAFSQSPFLAEFRISRETQPVSYNKLLAGSNGMIWCGTSQGLYRFDGITFAHIPLSHAESGQNVTALGEDTSGTLWAGFADGRIAMMKNQELRLCSLSPFQFTKRITSITGMKNGSLWICTAGEGILVIQGKNKFSITARDGLNDDFTYTAAEDPAGRIWIGTDQGIAIFINDDKKRILKKIRYADGLPDEIVRCILFDANGNALAGTQDKGVCTINGNSFSIMHKNNGDDFNDVQVNALQIQRDQIWMATENHGLASLSVNAQCPALHITSSRNFSIEKISDLIIDQQDNLWFCRQEGLVGSTGSFMALYENTGEEKISFVHSIHCDRSGRLFFTPDQGLVMTDAGCFQKFRKFTFDRTNKTFDITAIYSDPAGFTWAGTLGGGLFRLDPETGAVKKLPGFDQHERGGVLSMTGSADELWVTTLGGVLRFTIQNMNSFQDAQLLPRDFAGSSVLGSFYAYHVFIDSQNRTWLATDGKGLFMIDKNIYRSYGIKDGLKSEVIYSVSEDASKNIWFSAMNAGIYRFDGKSFYNYDERNGLRESVTSALLCDRNGQVIISHKRGIDILDIRSGLAENLGLEYGLEEINPDLNSITMDPDGKVWAGTEKGIICLDTKYHKTFSNPVAVILSVQVLPEALFIENNAQLHPKQNNLSFEYSGPAGFNAGNINFRYKLEGFNREWISTRDKKIIFTNLAPGTYKFKIQSSLQPGFYKPGEAVFSFSIDTPLIDRLWFRILLVLALSVIAFAYMHTRDQRTRRIEALKKEKIEFQFETLRSQVNPHFLFNSLNTLISIIETDSQTAVEYVEKLSDFYRSVLNYREQDLIPLDEEIHLAQTYYYLQQKRFGEHLVLKVLNPESFQSYFVPPLVLQILIENAIKHNEISREKNLIITMELLGNKLYVSNNINPKQTAEPSTGTGLPNIINRYELLSEEKVRIENDGKKFTVVLPLIRKK